MIDPADVQLPHWLMAVGTVLVVAGAVGLLLKRRRTEKAPPSKEEADPRVAQDEPSKRPTASADEDSGRVGLTHPKAP